MKRALFVALGLGLLAACRVPDLKPFSDATAAMATVLKQGFERSRDALSAAAEAGQDDRVKTQVRLLDERWNPTRRALSALVGYSDLLTALAEAGKRGPETMAQLTGAVNELASAVGAIPVTGATVAIVEAVGAKVIEMQAERDIRNAVAKAAEAVDILAPLLKANFAGLRSVHGAASRAWEAQVHARSSILTNYYESLVAEEQRLEHLLNLIVDYQSAPSRLRWRAAQARANGDGDLANELEASVGLEQADQLKRLQEYDSASEALDFDGENAAAAVEERQQHLIHLLKGHRLEIGLLEPKYQRAVAALTEIREARATGDRVLEKAGDAIGAWQKAHHSLQAAAQGQRTRPSVSELLSITSEIVGLLK